MQIAPDSDSFNASYLAGKAQVVYTRLVADLETPVSAFMKTEYGSAPCARASLPTIKKARHLFA
jgi:anthranilate synthase component 1